jgi:hypothetical protein
MEYFLAVVRINGGKQENALRLEKPTITATYLSLVVPRKPVRTILARTHSEICKMPNRIVFAAE